jgi:hypothetical protein
VPHLRRGFIAPKVGFERSETLSPEEVESRHLDRSSGRPHRPLRSGEIPVFAFASLVVIPEGDLLLFLPLSVLAVVCSCRCLFLLSS